MIFGRVSETPKMSKVLIGRESKYLRSSILENRLQQFQWPSLSPFGRFKISIKYTLNFKYLVKNVVEVVYSNGYATCNHFNTLFEFPLDSFKTNVVLATCNTFINSFQLPLGPLVERHLAERPPTE